MHCGSLVEAAEELDRRGLMREWTRMFLGGLPERSPLELSRPYVEMVAGFDRSPAGVRAVFGCCHRFGHYRLAQELLETIPEPERTPEDWVNLGFALGEQGRHADALAATRRASGPPGAPVEAWVLGNGSWYELELRPDAPRADLERWLGQALEARRLVAARPPAGLTGTQEWRHVLAAFHGIEAELRRRLGDPEGALRALSEADAHEAPEAQRLVFRSRALADLGRTREAREDVEHALTLLRPGSRHAENARRLLESLPSGGE